MVGMWAIEELRNLGNTDNPRETLETLGGGGGRHLDGRVKTLNLASEEA